MGLGILEESLRAKQWRPSYLTDLVDQDHAVDFGTDQHGIGDRQDGWTVEHDEIIVFFTGSDQIHDALRVEELRWVGRQMPAGDDTQVVHAGSAQNLIEPQLPEHQIRSALHHILPLRGPDQNLAQAGLPPEPEPAVDGRLSEVSV